MTTFNTFIIVKMSNLNFKKLLHFWETCQSIFSWCLLGNANRLKFGYSTHTSPKWSALIRQVNLWNHLTSTGKNNTNFLNYSIPMYYDITIKRRIIFSEYFFRGLKFKGSLFVILICSVKLVNRDGLYGFLRSYGS